MDDIKRYFEILGLKPGASLAEVKEAYKDLVKVWHPDRYEHDPKLQAKVQEKLKEINGAYQKVQDFLNNPYQYQQATGTSEEETKESAETNKSDDASYSQPPPKQPREERSAYRKDYQPPRPWVRFWARTLDLNIFLLVSTVSIGFLYGFIYALINNEAPSFPSLILISILLGIPIAFLIDALSMTLFGNTPCKAILRISVTNADGSKLSFRDALLRNMRVYFSGYGLGIPLVQLVTFIIAYNKLKNKGKTSWDEKYNFKVSHGHIGGGRVLIYCVVFFVFLIISALENELFENEMKKWINAEMEPKKEMKPWERFANSAPSPKYDEKPSIPNHKWVITDEKPLAEYLASVLVIDNNTGMMWQKQDDGNTYNWYQASGTYDATYNPMSRDVCGELNIGNYSDWRLPTKEELMSIVPYKEYFPNTKVSKFSNYWSSTTTAHNPDAAWSVRFNDGGVDHDLKFLDIVYVRCVRGGQ